MDLKITEDNLRNAYKKGCSDVKKTLSNLFPSFDFEDSIMIGNTVILKDMSGFCDVWLNDNYREFCHSKRFTVKFIGPGLPCTEYDKKYYYPDGNDCILQADGNLYFSQVRFLERI